MAPSTMSGESPKARGNILLLAIILATIMSLVLTLAFQPMRVRAMRQKESLLIYRGEHLAQGIRDFYFRFGRFPFELDELTDVEPRVVRKLYRDPMTKSGAWELVFLGQQHRSSLDRLREQATGQGRTIDPVRQSRFRNSLSGLGKQIIGIRSTSNETGYREYQESRIYSDWFFNAMAGESREGIKQLERALNEDDE